MSRRFIAKAYLIVFMMMLLIHSSCSIPHRYYSQECISNHASSGGVLFETRASEWQRSFTQQNSKKKHILVTQKLLSDTIRDVSEKSFSVIHNDNYIKPKVRIDNTGIFKRLKNPQIIPPMSTLSISFNLKREIGDSIFIIEHDIPNKGDSVVVKIMVDNVN